VKLMQVLFPPLSYSPFGTNIRGRGLIYWKRDSHLGLTCTKIQSVGRGNALQTPAGVRQLGRGSRVPIIISQAVSCRPLSSAPPGSRQHSCLSRLSRGRNCLRRPTCGPDDNNSLEVSAHGQGREDDHCLIDMSRSQHYWGKSRDTRVATIPPLNEG
jgi:hypothetical protein